MHPISAVHENQTMVDDLAVVDPEIAAAIEWARSLFGAEFANVQLRSRAQVDVAVKHDLLTPATRFGGFDPAGFRRIADEVGAHLVLSMPYAGYEASEKAWPSK